MLAFGKTGMSKEKTASARGPAASTSVPRNGACVQTVLAFSTVGVLSFPPLAMSISDTAATLGIGRTSVYAAIAQKRLDVRKLGRRTLVLTASITRLLEEATDGE